MENLEINNSFQNKKILITGWTGFIGSHLTHALLKSNANIYLWDKATKSHPEHLKSSIIDLTSSEQTCYQFNANYYDYVIHLAAKGRKCKTYNDILYDCQMTLNLIEALRSDKIGHLILLGSADQYGDARSPQNELTSLSPCSPYATSKSLIKNIISTTNHYHTLPVTMFIPFSVYGESQPEYMFIPQLIASLINKQEFHMSEGNQIRDFIYVGDVIQAIIKAITLKEQSYGIFNLGTGKGTKIFDLIDIAQKLTNQNITVQRGILKTENDPDTLVADITKLKKIFGWEPEISIEIGLKKVITFEQDKS